jgi:nucleoside-diphosphate-sugar epimerase
MKILVTGGAGYIGSVLVPMLLGQGHHVRVLDDLHSGGEGLLGACINDRFDLLHGDICDEKMLSASLRSVDVIVHLAAVVGYPACARQPENAIRTNVEGTSQLLAARHADQRLLFASTGSVYGSIVGSTCTEQSPLAPLSLYAKTKADAESLVLAAQNTISYRFATAFGASPRMRLDLLPNNFVYEAVHRRALKVYEGGFRRTFVHVLDIARSIVFALDRWTELADDVFNVGDETLNLSKVDLARRIRKHVDYSLEFEEFAEDPDRRDYSVSYEKIQAKGFRATVDLDRGISELVRAVQLLSGNRSKYD